MSVRFLHALWIAFLTHDHRLRFEMIPIASCPVACRSLALEILLGQNTRMIPLRQVIRRVASLRGYFSVILQRSDPQISIDSTLLVLSLSLVFRLYVMDFYTGLM